MKSADDLSESSKRVLYLSAALGFALVGWWARGVILNEGRERQRWDEVPAQERYKFLMGPAARSTKEVLWRMDVLSGDVSVVVIGSVTGKDGKVYTMPVWERVLEEYDAPNVPQEKPPSVLEEARKAAGF